jgi:hypothetical protein
VSRAFLPMLRSVLVSSAMAYCALATALNTKESRVSRCHPPCWVDCFPWASTHRP